MTRILSRSAKFLFAALLLAPLPALAKTFPIPDEDPIATISLPDKWEPETYDEGVEATSPDGAVYVAVEMVRANDVGSTAEEGVKFFAKQGVEIDDKSLTTKDIKINGLAAYDMTMTGKDKNGPTEVGMTLVGTNAQGKFLMIYFWGSQEGQTSNKADLETIAQSLQATK
jgi:hypothetical protein